MKSLLTTTILAICVGSAFADPVQDLRKFLADSKNDRAKISIATFAGQPLSKTQAEAAARLLSNDRLARIRRDRAEEMKRRVIQAGKMKMPFWYKAFGKKPAGGRSLFISLHGGGGTAPRVNDQQYENQKRLYAPREGVYLVPRAPTNTWNLWHQGHIDGMFDRLIENMIAFENVNPNRVYVMGYSAGGDGVYQLAPRMADRWAAAAMMAGHPGDAAAKSLRNIGFTVHVGGRDAAYSRNKHAEKWGEKLAALQKADPKGYAHWVKVYPRRGHWLNREDRAAVPWMAKYKRNPFPRRVVWQQDNVTHARFYWLAVTGENRKARSQFTAQVDGQVISLEASVPVVSLRLHDQLLDLDRKIEVKVAGKVVWTGKAKRTIAAIAKSLQERADPASVCYTEIEIRLPE